MKNLIVTEPGVALQNRRGSLCVRDVKEPKCSTRLAFMD